MKRNNIFKILSSKVFKIQGYNLLQMLVVSVILAILVMVGVEAYVNMRCKAEALSERAIIASLNTAVHTYYARNLRWYGENINENPFDLLGDSAPPSTVGIVFPPCNRDPVEWYLLWDANRWWIYCPHSSNVPCSNRANRWHYEVFPTGTEKAGAFDDLTYGHCN